MEFDDSTRFAFLPLQICRTEAGAAFIRRGPVQLKVSGDAAADVAEAVVDILRGGPASLAEIESHFLPEDQPAVAQLLQAMISRRLLINKDDVAASTVPEKQIDVFHWSLKLDTMRVETALQRNPQVLIGLNSLTKSICDQLEASGARDVTIVDYAPLNSRTFSNDPAAEDWRLRRQVISDDLFSELKLEPGAIVVAATDFGGLALLRELNARSLERGFRFFPIGLQDCIGYIGPLVIPGDTACFDCLRGRQNSHLSNPMEQRQSEPHAHAYQDLAAVHPTIVGTTACIAAFEILRAVAWRRPPHMVNTLIEVNLLQGQVVRRSVFKIPRCPTCSGAATTPSSNVLKDFHIPTKGFSR